MAGFDLLGQIAIINFPDKIRKKTLKEKKEIANSILSKNNNIKTVLEKVERVKGRLRKPTTKHLAGKKTKEAFYRENTCVFKFNIDETYFSPRLSNERKEIAKKIKKKDKVLVMFAGVAPFSIVIAKLRKPAVVYSVELNKKASKYAEENVKLNKVANKVKVVQGDVKKIIPKIREKFDIIIMPRPQLKDTFLQQAFAVAKRGTLIFYYGFAKQGDEKKIVEQIETEAKNTGRKIKIKKIKKAGNIAPYKYRWRIDFVVR